MLYIQLRSGAILVDHIRSRAAALDRLINYDFLYAEWCGAELTHKDL